MSKIQKGTEEFQMFQDFWKLYNEFHDVELGDQYCDRVKNALDDFANRYKQFYMSEKLWMALFDYINHEMLAMEGKK